MNENLPFIQQKLHKLCEVHGDHHIELFEIKELFDGAVENLNAHLHDEETILFPYLRKLVAYKNSNVSSNFEFLDVQNTIQQMDLEHTMEGERFAKIVRLTNNYTCPADGCNTYQVTFKTLQEFEKDLHRHIHLESNILFKKAVIFERDLTN